MRLAVAIIFLFFIYTKGISQCDDPIVTDASFEDGTFPSEEFPQVEGVWYRDDGADLQIGGAYHLNNSVCSNGGGGFQRISVEENTTYYLNCYVFNAANDDYPSLMINSIPYPISLSSNDWTLVSQEFNSGTDTVATIGFYSAGACFDLFSVTCEAIVDVNSVHDNTPPYSIFPTISNDEFIVETTSSCTVEVLNLNGQIVERIEMGIGSNYVGGNLAAAIYIVRVFLNGKYYFSRIIKK